MKLTDLKALAVTFLCFYTKIIQHHLCLNEHDDDDDASGSRMTFKHHFFLLPTYYAFLITKSKKWEKRDETHA